MSLARRLEALAERSHDWVPPRISEKPEKPARPRWGRRTFSDKTPRPLAGDDVDSFLLASGEARDAYRRELEAAHPPKTEPVERADFLKWVAKRNGPRLNRLGRELDWLRREARRYGINPEEIRWLL